MSDLKHLKTVVPAEIILSKAEQREKDAQMLGISVGALWLSYDGLWEEKEIKLVDEINVYEFILTKFLNSLDENSAKYKKLRLTENDFADKNELLKKLIRNTIQRIDRRNDELGEIDDFTSFTLRYCVDLCLYCCDQHDEESISHWFSENFPEINTNFNGFLENIYQNYAVEEGRAKPKYTKLPIHLKKVSVVDGSEVTEVVTWARTSHTRKEGDGLIIVPYSYSTDTESTESKSANQQDKQNTTTNGFKLHPDQPLTAKSVLESNREVLDRIENFLKSKYPELITALKEMEEKKIFEKMRNFVGLVGQNDLLDFYTDSKMPQIFEARNTDFQNMVSTLNVLDLLKDRRPIISNWILLFAVGSDFNALISFFTDSEHFENRQFEYSVSMNNLIDSIRKKYYHMDFEDIKIFGEFLDDLEISLDTLDSILPNATTSEPKAGLGFGKSKAIAEGLETYKKSLSEQLAFFEIYLEPELFLSPKLAMTIIKNEINQPIPISKIGEIFQLNQYISSKFEAKIKQSALTSISKIEPRISKTDYQKILDYLKGHVTNTISNFITDSGKIISTQKYEQLQIEIEFKSELVEESGIPLQVSYSGKVMLGEEEITKFSDKYAFLI